MSELEDARKNLEFLVTEDNALIVQAYDVKKTAAIRQIGDYSEFVSGIFMNSNLTVDAFKNKYEFLLDFCETAVEDITDQVGALKYWPGAGDNFSLGEFLMEIKPPQVLIDYVAAFTSVVSSALSDYVAVFKATNEVASENDVEPIDVFRSNQLYAKMCGVINKDDLGIEQISQYLISTDKAKRLVEGINLIHAASPISVGSREIKEVYFDLLNS